MKRSSTRWKVRRSWFEPYIPCRNVHPAVARQSETCTHTPFTLFHGSSAHTLHMPWTRSTWASPFEPAKIFDNMPTDLYSDGVNAFARSAKETCSELSRNERVRRERRAVLRARQSEEACRRGIIRDASPCLWWALVSPGKFGQARASSRPRVFATDTS